MEICKLINIQNFFISFITIYINRVIFEIDDFGQVKGWVSWSVGKVKPKPYKD